jgi:hypothetical protein
MRIRMMVCVKSTVSDRLVEPKSIEDLRILWSWGQARVPRCGGVRVHS